MKKYDVDGHDVATWLMVIICAVALFVVFALSGCMTPKKINEFKQIYCRDSVSIQIRDNVVNVPVYYSDSAFMELWLECDSCGTVYFNSWHELDGKYIELKKKLENNVLKVVSYISIRDTVEVITHDTIVKETVKIEHPGKVTWWQRVKSILTGVVSCLVIGLIIFVIYFFRKKILALFRK